MALQGKIIVNPFGIPGQNLHQAKRLKEEFTKKGVEVEILPQAFLRVHIQDNTLASTLDKTDFIIFFPPHIVPKAITMEQSNIIFQSG